MSASEEDTIMLFKAFSEALADAANRGQKIGLIFDVSSDEGVECQVKVSVGPYDNEDEELDQDIERWHKAFETVSKSLELSQKTNKMLRHRIHEMETGLLKIARATNHTFDLADLAAIKEEAMKLRGPGSIDANYK